MKCFFKMSVVSYVFVYADFGENTQKIWHVQFLQKSGIYVYKELSLIVLLISNIEMFFLKSECCFLCILYADFGKILKTFWHVQFLHKSRIYVWKGLNLVSLLVSNTGG